MRKYLMIMMYAVALWIGKSALGSLKWIHTANHITKLSLLLWFLHSYQFWRSFCMCPGHASRRHITVSVGWNRQMNGPNYLFSGKFHDLQYTSISYVHKYIRSYIHMGIYMCQIRHWTTNFVVKHRVSWELFFVSLAAL